MARDVLVLKLGGSVLTPSSAPDPAIYRAYAREIASFVRETSVRVFVVVGGGRPARNYISCARALGATETEADELGIAISRVNAYLMALALASEGVRVPPSIPSSAKEACYLMSTGAYDCVVSGGFSPGQSTTACAALIAERARARILLVGTNVPGVFTSDPRRDPRAKKLDKLTYAQLKTVAARTSRAGSYELVDDVALGVLERSAIPLFIFDATSPENVRLALHCAVKLDFSQLRTIGSLVCPQV